MISREELEDLQSMSLNQKYRITINTIKEWHNKYNGNIYVSWSGGLDSTVLASIARSIYPEITLVFSNTGLEYPEIVKFVYSKIPDRTDYVQVTRKGHKIRQFKGNVVILRPKLSYREVIENYGYPVISKATAGKIKALQNPTDNNKLSRKLYKTGKKRTGETSKLYKLSDKWQFLIDAPFRISNHCCYAMKKSPIYHYNKISFKKGMVGTRAEEGHLRELSYQKNGCNNYKKGKSKPLSIWTHQDILKYVYENDVDYCQNIYGKIKKEGKEYYTTGSDRTGCMFCMFGIHLEKEPNRFQRMYETHPKLWKYCMNDLGIKKVLKYINIPYKPPEGEK